MDINWFTVIAQALNFLILVWLLKKFLYKPILNAVNEREKKITDQLKDADAQKATAQKEKEDFQKKNEDFDSKKKALLYKAVADANVEKKQLMDSAKETANALGATMEKAFKEQQNQDKKELSQNTQEHVFAITRKALTDLASVSLETQTVDIFIHHLKAATDTEKQQFIDAFKANSNAILIKSAFALSEKQQGNLTDAVNEVLDTKTTLQFKIAPEIISGIELSTNGYKMAWSFSEYLSALQKNSSKEIKDNITPQPEKKEHANT
jgi:F-type H+-transporting ATPase subunit b